MCLENQVVALPTETVYMLCTTMNVKDKDDESVQRLNQGMLIVRSIYLSVTKHDAHTMFCFYPHLHQSIHPLLDDPSPL